MERFRQDLRFGFRSLLRQPGISLVAVLTLALGFGANMAMVSFAEAILFPDLPYDDPDRLVVLERWRLSEPDLPPMVSLPAVSDWKQRNRICSDIGVLLQDRRTLTGGHGEPERLDSRLVSANLLPLLGIQPFLGPGFSPDDDRPEAERTTLLSHELWQRRFGGDPEILKKTVTVDGHQHAVVGVLPAGLSSEKLGQASLGDIWLPVGRFHDELPVDDRRVAKDWGVVCRLDENVSLDAARQDMRRINRELAEEYPSTDENKAIRVTSVPEHLVGDIRPVVLALLAVVVFVLIIACANLIHLYLARGVARQREFAIRMALGAGHKRLILQGMSEALVLTVAGGVVGLFVAATLIRTLPAVLTEVPHAEQARISPVVWICAVVLGLVVTLMIGLVPALQTISPSWQHLASGSLGSLATPLHRRLREALIVGEIALAVVVLTGTGLALVTYLNLSDEHPGFSTDQIVSLEIALGQSKYGDASTWTAYFDEALARARNHPGVAAAAVTSTLPMGDLSDQHGAGVVAGDRPLQPTGKREVTQYLSVSPDFFQVLDIPIVEGRTFTPHDDDREGARRAIVLSENLARFFWPERPAVGQKVGFEFVGEKSEVRWREVVGVVGDVRYQELRQAPQYAVYVPYTQRPIWVEGTSPKMALVAKAASEPLALAAALRSKLLEIDPDQPIDGLRTFEDVLDEQLAESRMVLILLAFFAGLALTLAVVGIYGVVSYLVTARTREIGLRMALGARPSQVLARLILRNLALVMLGVGTGCTLAALLTRFLSSQLYNVDPLDPRILLAGGVALTLVALLATLVPALQASRVDPTQALRHE